MVIKSASNDEYASISVVISAYNRPDYLKASLESVLSQSLSPEEIIVVDDCSPTELLPVIESFGTEKIIYIRSEKNMGANASRNIGLQRATGDYVAFLDDDDIWGEEKIDIQLRHMDQYSFDACLCGYSNLGGRRDSIYPKVDRVYESDLKKGNPFCGMSGLIGKTDIIQELMFDESLPCGQDWDIYVRIAKHHKIGFVPKNLFQYRIGGHEGITSKGEMISVEGFGDRLASIRKHRAWLGEKHYKSRIAKQILLMLPRRTNKLSWVRYSAREAGWYSTVRCITLLSLAKVNRRFYFIA